MAVTGNDALRQRIRGTVPGTNSALFNAFRTRYSSKFPGIFPDVFGMAGAYDSTYLVALAIASIGNGPITGAAIADAMKKMVGGTKFIVGQDKTQDALNAIATKSLDVDGASGPLDFDLSLHEAPSDIDVFCIANQAGTPVFISSGRFFDATTQKMAGVYACP
jgi:branched-chain amino acid transport system substrate-binding protein